MTVPDYTARIAGARSWRVANTMWARMGGLLWADVILEPWPVGEEYRAKCDGNPKHRPPAEGCNCGIYAWYTVESLVKEWYKPEDFRHVSGIVSARGDVELHDWGGRSTSGSRPFSMTTYPTKTSRSRSGPSPTTTTSRW